MRWIFPALLAATLTLATSSFAIADSFPMGTAPSRLDSLKAMLGLLKAEETSDSTRSRWVGDKSWSRIPKLYFGDAYDSHLADLIVLLDRRNYVHAALVVDGKVRPHPTLYGNKKVWLLLLTHTDLNWGVTDIGDTLRYAFNLDFEPLTYASDYGEKTIRDVLHAGLSDLGNLTSDEAKSESLSKSDSMYIKFRGSLNGDSLFVGLLGFELQTNSLNRIVARPVKRELPFRSISLNFAEYSGARIGGGLGIGYTFRTSSSQFDGDRVNGYVLAHYYLRQARLPGDPWCAGPVLGTSVGSGGIQKSLLVGFRTGLPLLGQAGLWGGVNLLSGAVFRRGVVAGLDYRL